jgi:hypothetical protein
MENSEMEAIITEYKTAKKLALKIKLALDSYLSQTPFEPLEKILSREELRDFLGKTLDSEKYRKMAFAGGSAVTTLRDTIFSQKKNGTVRRTLFVELLKEYNPEVYGRLLADLKDD